MILISVKHSMFVIDVQGRINVQGMGEFEHFSQKNKVNAKTFDIFFLYMTTISIFHIALIVSESM